MEVGSRYVFVIPIQRNSHVLQAIVAALTYAKQIRRDVPEVINIDNAKADVAHTTVEAGRQLGTTTTTPVSYDPEENGISERLIRTIMEGV